jgi:hypothetical protein
MKYWLIITVTQILQSILTLELTSHTSKTLVMTTLNIETYEFNAILEAVPSGGQSKQSKPGYVIFHDNYKNWFSKDQGETQRNAKIKIIFVHANEPIDTVASVKAAVDPSEYKSLDKKITTNTVDGFIYDVSDCSSDLICYVKDGQGYVRFHFDSEQPNDEKLTEKFEKANMIKTKELVKMALTITDFAGIKEIVKELLMHLNLLNIVNTNDSHLREMRKLLVLPENYDYAKEKQADILTFIGDKYGQQNFDVESDLTADLDSFTVASTLPKYNAHKNKNDKKKEIKVDYNDSGLRRYVRDVIVKQILAWTNRDLRPKSDLYQDDETEIPYAHADAHIPAGDILLEKALQAYSDELIQRIYQKFSEEANNNYDLDKDKVREIFYESIQNAISGKVVLTEVHEGFTVYKAKQNRIKGAITQIHIGNKQDESFLNPLVYVLKQGPATISETLELYSLQTLKSELKQFRKTSKKIMKRYKKQKTKDEKQTEKETRKQIEMEKKVQKNLKSEEDK